MRKIKIHPYIAIYLIPLLFGCANNNPSSNQWVYLATHLNHQLEKKNEAKQKRLEHLLKSAAMQKVYDRNLVIKAEVRKLNRHVGFLLEAIQTQKQELVHQVAGGMNPQTGRPYDLVNVAGVHKYMLLGAGNTSLGGYKLKKQLDSYVIYLNKEFGSYGVATLPKFAEGNENNALYVRQPKEKEKDFPEAYFRGTPVIMALVYLAHFEATILSYQEEVIQYFLLNTITQTNH